jgi:hypothetical protein
MPAEKVTQDVPAMKTNNTTYGRYIPHKHNIKTLNQNINKEPVTNTYMTPFVTPNREGED